MDPSWVLRLDHWSKKNDLANLSSVVGKKQSDYNWLNETCWKKLNETKWITKSPNFKQSLTGVWVVALESEEVSNRPLHTKFPRNPNHQPLVESCRLKRSTKSGWVHLCSRDQRTAHSLKKASGPENVRNKYIYIVIVDHQIHRA